MKNITFLLALMLTACGPQYMKVDLTPEGEKVLLLDVSVPPQIPGRPLDSCAAITRINLVNLDQFAHYSANAYGNALRNETAEKKGNFVIVFSSLPFNSYGLAMNCPDDALKGISSITDVQMKGRPLTWEEMQKLRY